MAREVTTRVLLGLVAGSAAMSIITDGVTQGFTTLYFLVVGGGFALGLNLWLLIVLWKEAVDG